jgi:hypothetical protein
MLIGYNFTLMEPPLKRGLLNRAHHAFMFGEAMRDAIKLPSTQLTTGAAFGEGHGLNVRSTSRGSHHLVASSKHGRLSLGQDLCEPLTPKSCYGSCV